jgi:uncharacterized protein
MKLKKVKAILIRHKRELGQFGVISLALFGSVVRDETTLKSDIDILIDFDSKKGIFVFVDLKHYLESILSCEVDLVTKNALHPALRKKILQEAKRVF